MMDKLICVLCGEPISKGDLSVFYRADGEEDFTTEPTHRWCERELEERMPPEDGAKS